MINQLKEEEKEWSKIGQLKTPVILPWKDMVISPLH
jgi:hypothetical protein